MSDRGLLALAESGSLQSVVAGDTAVTAAGADALQRAQPRIRISLDRRPRETPDP